MAYQLWREHLCCVQIHGQDPILSKILQFVLGLQVHRWKESVDDEDPEKWDTGNNINNIFMRLCVWTYLQ